MKYLFIAGCPRSGTTALNDLLNSDDRIILGLERFKFIRANLNPEHFTEEQFFDVKKEETNLMEPELYKELHKRWLSGKAVYIGDKVPAYFYQMSYLLENFPDSKILFTFRDLERVASSYNVRAQGKNPFWPPSKNYEEAVKIWNLSLKRVKQVMENPVGMRVFIVKYESFFKNNIEYLNALYNFLEIEISDKVKEVYTTITKKAHKIAQKPLRLTEEEREYLNQNKNHELEAWCLSHCFKNS